MVNNDGFSATVAPAEARNDGYSSGSGSFLSVSSDAGR